MHRHRPRREHFPGKRDSPAGGTGLDPGVVQILKAFRLPGALAGLCTGAAAAGALLAKKSRAWRKSATAWTWAAAFILGAAAYPLALGLIQAPLHVALSRWQAGILPHAGPLALSILPVVLSGLVQEPAKLLGVVAACLLSPLLGPPPAWPPLLGTFVGAGFAAAQGTWLLSVTFSTISVHRQLGLPSLALSVLERTWMGFFHVASATLLAWAWHRSPRLAFKALGLLAGLHALLTYSQVLTGAGVLGAWLPQVLAALVALVLTGYAAAGPGTPWLSQPGAGENRRSPGRPAP